MKIRVAVTALFCRFPFGGAFSAKPRPITLKWFCIVCTAHVCACMCACTSWCLQTLQEVSCCWTLCDSFFLSFFLLIAEAAEAAPEAQPGQ